MLHTFMCVLSVYCGPLKITLLKFTLVSLEAVRKWSLRVMSMEYRLLILHHTVAFNSSVLKSAVLTKLLPWNLISCRFRSVLTGSKMPLFACSSFALMFCRLLTVHQRSSLYSCCINRHLLTDWRVIVCDYGVFYRTLLKSCTATELQLTHCMSRHPVLANRYVAS